MGMITITQAAARQIRRSADSGSMEELALRITASRNPDGSIGYQMGFDEISANDVLVNARGVDVPSCVIKLALLMISKDS